MENNDIMLSKYDLGEIINNFKGINNTVKFDEFFRVCMLLKE